MAEELTFEQIEEELSKLMADRVLWTWEPTKRDGLRLSTEFIVRGTKRTAVGTPCHSGTYKEGLARIEKMMKPPLDKPSYRGLSVYDSERIDHRILGFKQSAGGFKWPLKEGPYHPDLVDVFACLVREAQARPALMTLRQWWDAEGSDLCSGTPVPDVVDIFETIVSTDRFLSQVFDEKERTRLEELVNQM